MLRITQDFFSIKYLARAHSVSEAEVARVADELGLSASRIDNEVYFDANAAAAATSAIRKIGQLVKKR